MGDCTGKYYSLGNSFNNVPLPPDVQFSSGTWIYEVLRVINGSCIFLEDHLNRLNVSLRLAGISFRLGYHEAFPVIQELVRRNGLENGNIKLMIQMAENNTPIWVMCCIPFSYPQGSDYEFGVSTAIFRAARENPNIKQYYPLYQKQMADFITAKNRFEALLVDDQDRITEGSKSNVFFIRDQTLFTAPGASVLKGITRDKVISMCSELKYKLIEKAVSTADLSNMDSVFITGTSPKVLPVCRVDDQSFNVDHPMMRNIMKVYDRLIESEISRIRTALQRNL